MLKPKTKYEILKDAINADVKTIYDNQRKNIITKNLCNLQDLIEEPYLAKSLRMLLEVSKRSDFRTLKMLNTCLVILNSKLKSKGVSVQDTVKN